MIREPVTRSVPIYDDRATFAGLPYTLQVRTFDRYGAVERWAGETGRVVRYLDRHGKAFRTIFFANDATLGVPIPVEAE